MVRNFLSAFQFAHAFVQGANYTIGIYPRRLLDALEPVAPRRAYTSRIRHRFCRVVS
jgi:hypothetical protein